ncbi:uncharacterized protein LOC111045522 [Nilaparvata lugens]|uniref:uncharacterized protein LOC111045522 n=1 Tax=Nilaparvata lugens TaxID=108931 RepID=UPI00193EB8E0|nr:uncharacterized protein LOC111045522 [Nilaparvata lugens]
MMKSLLFAVSIFYLIENFCVVLSEEIASPLRVAQCRASCVHIFQPALGSDRCRKGSECSICWDACKVHQPNVSSICSQPSICGPGCEAACQFASEADSGAQRAPVLVRRGEEVLKRDGEETRWPAPAPELEGPWVYLVMRRLTIPGSSWRQITQTLDLAAKIPTGGMVRVLVVGKDGLVTIYGPEEEEDAVPNAAEGPGWHLREVSVIHQEAVVIAEVAWESRKPHGLYLVTWEVAGGGLRGNLITTSTCVALSLWPDTQFHVQVEIMMAVRHYGDSGDTSSAPLPLKSEELIIDTRRSKEMEVLEEEEENELEAVEERLKAIEDGDHDRDVKQNLVVDKSPKSSQRHPKAELASYLFAMKSNNSSSMLSLNMELLTGVLSAMSLFLLLMGIYLLTRTERSDKPQLTSQQEYPTISVVTVPDVLKPCNSQHSAAFAVT